jgi:demethylmenaquinone methyltransferase/2-methoxy-6-polyprenyl-1,4-benzoquinol methylase
MHKKTEISKKETPAMFDNIADTYDKLNHILSFGLDKKWRRKFVQKLQFREYKTIADIACGTGDLLVELQNLNAKKYYAIDPAANMLEIAKIKLPKADYIISTAETIPLESESCDLITVSFGIRNFSSLSKSFNEFYRILKPNGIVSIMEFSQPKFFLFKWGFVIYLKLFLPIIGRIISKDKSAYKYLQSSIFDFAKNVDVIQELENQNFTKLNQTNLLFGSVRIYSVVK